ncbi:MAG: hypothetical protein LBU07_01890 [Coriobacteriales bacterium]|jgi:hypothetical protein|nr:hypothetical protein [Coriobacteriales bacterium]
MAKNSLKIPKAAKNASRRQGATGFGWLRLTRAFGTVGSTSLLILILSTGQLACAIGQPSVAASGPKTAFATVFPPHIVLVNDPAAVGNAREELPNIAELQEQVDAAQVTYDNANRRILDIETQLSEVSGQMSLIDAQLPAARKASGEAAAEYYRLHNNANLFLEVLFGARNLADLLAQMEYAIRVNQYFLEDIGQLAVLNEQLSAAQAALQEGKAALKEEERRAQEALNDALVLRNEAEAVARRIAEETAAATAAAAEAEAAQEHARETPLPVMSDPSNATGSTGGNSGNSTSPGGSNNNTPSGNIPSDPPPNNNASTDDKQSFVNIWAPRIDAYLAGSPLASYGYAFANAAWDYNVDPRWSPAIACLESSKGRYLFKDYNAWGWGQVSWKDWETAIYAHVRGLASSYGQTISEAAAKKYCPPNWEYWFTFVSNQMTLI